MFTERLKQLNKSNTAIIFKGNFISKVILVIGGLFLAKYYGSAEYGFYSIYLSISAIFAILISLGLDHLIVLSIEKEQFENNFKFVNLLSLAIICIFVLIIFFFDFSFISKKIYIAGAISGFLIQFVNNTKFLLAKEKNFKKITHLTVTDAGISFLMQLFFLLIHFKNGLVVGSFIGFFAAFLLSVFYARLSTKNLDFFKFYEDVKKRKDLITMSYPSTLINTIGNNIMPILISSFFIAKIVGEYSLAIRILSIPLLLISSSIATVYYPKAVELFHSNVKKDLINYTKKISIRNFLIITLLYIALNSLGIFLLRLFFNKNWENLGSFVFLLSFGFLARSLINPISDIFTIYKKNNITLVFNIYLLLSNIVAIYFGYHFGFYYLVSIFSLLLSIGYGYLFYFIIFRLNHTNHESN